MIGHWVVVVGRRGLVVDLEFFFENLLFSLFCKGFSRLNDLVISFWQFKIYLTSSRGGL